jgi:hypothetical protein
LPTGLLPPHHFGVTAYSLDDALSLLHACATLPTPPVVVQAWPNSRCEHLGRWPCATQYVATHWVRTTSRGLRTTSASCGPTLEPCNSCSQAFRGWYFKTAPGVSLVNTLVGITAPGSKKWRACSVVPRRRRMSYSRTLRCRSTRFRPHWSPSVLFR